jgi:hypothetical protein
MFPTDHIVVGGDFNYHFFERPDDSFEQDFQKLVKFFNSESFQMFPRVDTPPTFRMGRGFSVIDYILVRGFTVLDFQVAEDHAITNHRPLWLKVEVPNLASTPDIHLEQALTTAYIRSDSKKAMLRQLLELVATEELQSHSDAASDVQRAYDKIENALLLSTKRTVRKPFAERWENELDSNDIATLQEQRTAVLEFEKRL